MVVLQFNVNSQDSETGSASEYVCSIIYIVRDTVRCESSNLELYVWIGAFEYIDPNHPQAKLRQTLKVEPIKS